MDDRQTRHLKKLYTAAVKRAPAMRLLKDKLLALGGRDVVFAEPNPFVDLLLEHGCVYSGKARFRLGEPCECHWNSRATVLGYPKRYLYATGYGLSNDGLWRCHSWVLTMKARQIVETTERREVYFGIDMTAETVEKVFRDRRTSAAR